MWIATTIGFFSAVCANKGPNDRTMDPDTLMVRARSRVQLQALIDSHPCLRGTKINTGGADYSCRIFVPKLLWAEILTGLVEDVDYKNFKSAASSCGHSLGSPYAQFLGRVWTAGIRMQERTDRVGYAKRPVDASDLAQTIAQDVIRFADEDLREAEDRFEDQLAQAMDSVQCPNDLRAAVRDLVVEELELDG